MASTNKTTNYELSQFLGTDKPAWLSDYNTDMSKIDAQMKVNADAATAASGSASAADGKIGTLSSLTTDAKTNVVAAINEVDSHADAAQTTASSANTIAGGCRTDLDKFNLTNRSNLTPNINIGTVGNLTNVQFATDNTNSIYKVYGRVQITNLYGVSGSLTLKLGSTSLRPTTAYEINTGALIVVTNSNDVVSSVGSRNLRIDTNGDITVITPTESSLITLDGTTKFINIYISPCLYFNTNFGDN